MSVTLCLGEVKKETWKMSRRSRKRLRKRAEPISWRAHLSTLLMVGAAVLRKSGLL